METSKSGNDDNETGDVAEESLKRAQYELLELVKQQGGIQVDAESNLEASSKIALVTYRHCSL